MTDRDPSAAAPRLRALAALAVVVSGLVLLPGLTDQAEAGKKKARPNIVLIQADDAIVSDLKYMPNVRRLMKRGGTNFSNYFVSYSLCCTARTTLLTGQFSHNHGVLSNFRSNDGGYYRFRDLPGRRNQKNSLGPWLRKAYCCRTVHTSTQARTACQHHSRLTVRRI